MNKQLTQIADGWMEQMILPFFYIKVHITSLY